MDIFLATGIQVTVIPPIDIHPLRSPAMDIQATQVLRVTPVPRPTHTRADLVSRVIPLPPDIRASRNIPSTSVRRTTNTKPMKVTLLAQVRRVMDQRAIWEAPLTLVPSLTDIRTARFILPTRVPVMDLLPMDTPAIAPRRTGLRTSPHFWRAPIDKRQSISSPVVAGRWENDFQSGA